MKISAVILSLIASTVLIVQTGVPKSLDTPPAAQSAGITSSTAQDPLGRATPRGSILGFTRAAQSGDYKQAMQYLQLSPLQRKEYGEELAKDLKVVLDQGFVGSVLRLSDRPEGTLQADLPADRERAGRLVAGHLEADLMLNRVPGANGDIWLISHDTLEQVPDLYSETRTQQFEAELPAPLVNHSFLGIALWQWLAIFILAPLCWLVAWLLSHLAVRLRKGKKVSPSGIATRAGSDLVLPSSLLLACVLNIIAVRQLHLPFLSRFYYFRVLSLTILVSVTWLVWRLIVRAAEAWQIRAIAKGQVSTGTLLILGRRVAKVCLVILLLLAVFKALGFDMTAAVAGLGIGGIAIAFGAQKTLENLLGGISLLRT